MHDKSPGQENMPQLCLYLNQNCSSADDHTASSIIENSYLGETLILARAASKNSTDETSIITIEKLAAALDLFEIRNAISHPNRSFPECFWYRCAAIATDPAIYKLGFHEVSIAFENACDGRIQEPPEDWLYKKRWSVPAILPDEFEHDSTGLVGRNKESASLLRDLKNRRAPLISIVARGGIGKTSLTLQTVSDFCLSTEASHFVDGVIWTSLKQEKLTGDGIRSLSSPASIEEMKIDISNKATELFGIDFSDFEELKDQLKESRILLCLDNLETVIRDSPEVFNSFYEDLPENWKVIVTSRIPVDSAKNIPLAPLNSTGANALARNYFTTKGHSDFTPDLIETISSGCRFNPLAIRLTIDAYIAGIDITEAIKKTDKDITDFSFRSLLDSLSNSDNSVLEAIFTLDHPSRAQLCEALQLSQDSVAEALGKLQKTSLISRLEESTETFEIHSSIRELLRAQPRDVETRLRVNTWLKKSRDSIDSALKLQASKNVSQVDLRFIPPSTSANLISISKGTSKNPP